MRNFRHEPRLPVRGNSEIIDMARSSALVASLAAVLIAGSVGLAHAQARGGAGGTGGGHRQPQAGDLPRNDSQPMKRDQTEKKIDRLIGGICRGC
jgi:hypothetical protein